MTPSTRVYVLALLAWLVLALGIGTFWVASAANRLRAGFDQETRILHRILSQKTEQHEAVLAGLVALEKNQVNRQTLQGFASAMQARYGQIEGIGSCEKQGQSCQPMLLSGRLIAAQALPQGSKPVAASADGSRIVLSQATAQGGFWIWIDSQRFAGLPEFAQSASSFELFSKKGGTRLYNQTPNEVAFGLGLPRFTIEKPLGSASQPFWLQAERRVAWSELPLAPMLGFLLGGALLSLGAVRARQSGLEARQQHLATQRALQQERAQAEATLKAIDDALFSFDRSGNITLVNPAALELLGVERSALVHVPLAQALPLQATLTQQPLGELFAQFWQTPALTELPEGTSLRDPSGALRLVEGSLAPLYEGGVLSGGVLALRDLGPFRKRMLETLEDSERRLREHESLLAHTARMGTLSEIAAGIAHELGQPLTAILSQNQAALRLLGEEPADLPKVEKSLQASANQARRAGQILERLRAHVARQPLRRERVDLRQVVQNVEILSESELGASGVRLETELGNQPLEVEGDAIQLEQVLHNLIRNALGALSSVPADRRVIRVLAYAQGPQRVLEVRDSGPGIAPEVLPRLFEPFVSNKPQGMGLGLSLSQTLMQGMGGSLHGENLPSGGARFVLSLPALPIPHR